MVDTAGLLAAVVHPADVPDRDGARLVLAELAGKMSRRRLIWAGGASSEWVRERLGCRLEIVSRAAGLRGFAVLPRGWWGRQRRLSKDYEELPESSAAWVQIAMSRLMLRRIAQKPAF